MTLAIGRPADITFGSMEAGCFSAAYAVPAGTGSGRQAREGA
jgi:hypothetical protein